MDDDERRTVTISVEKSMVDRLFSEFERAGISRSSLTAGEVLSAFIAQCFHDWCAKKDGK